MKRRDFNPELWPISPLLTVAPTGPKSTRPNLRERSPAPQPGARAEKAGAFRWVLGGPFGRTNWSIFTMTNGKSMGIHGNPWEIHGESKWVCLKMVSSPKPNGFADHLMIIIPIKWQFHWEYTLFSDKPKWGVNMS